MGLLEMAERHIAEGIARIERQRRVIAEMRARDAGLGLQLALDLLEEFEERQRIVATDLKRIKAELERATPPPS
jgi:hypothetical protein